jgi:hypothetical protein
MTEKADELRALVDRVKWLEANAARCAKVHPNADCHKLYRRNAARARAEIEEK